MRVHAGIFLCLASLSAVGHCQYNLSKKQATWWSNQGYAGTVTLGTLLPLVLDGKEGANHSLRVLETGLTTLGTTVVLKKLFPETRPNGKDRESFPSTTAALTFAVAHMNAKWRPKEALLWYGAATFCSISRLQLKAHFQKDVIFGAALGIGIAELNLRSDRGWVLAPLVTENGTGLMFSSKF